MSCGQTLLLLQATLQLQLVPILTPQANKPLPPISCQRSLFSKTLRQVATIIQYPLQAVAKESGAESLARKAATAWSRSSSPAEGRHKAETHLAGSCRSWLLHPVACLYWGIFSWCFSLNCGRFLAAPAAPTTWAQLALSRENVTDHLEASQTSPETSALPLRLRYQCLWRRHCMLPPKEWSPARMDPIPLFL